MKIVALISGGKDSCFNMMHCVANGHQITALANLKPLTDSRKDELDSFLYQTVGHNAISYYAECMGLPLYRREIFGQSLIQDADYKLTIGDETEDLFELLKEVKESNPDVQGVSVGAILSNYQRVRVENVCSRLGLTPIAYLWRRNQKELLSEMIDAGINAILIKVAAIGECLKTTHLGKSIKELYPYLCSLNEKYDVHICGEGGEYETFILDCPLFIKRLHVENSEIIMHSDNAFAEVAYLQLKKLVVMDKPVNIAMTNLIKVPAWSDGFEDILSKAEIFKGENVLKNVVPKIDIDYIPEMNNDYIELYTAHANPPYFAISGTTAYNHKSSQSPLNTIEEETRVCMKNLEEKLAKLGLNWADVINMNVFIKDMKEFGRMNMIYKSFFDINPPTRACVECNLSSPANVQIDLVAIKFSDYSNIKPINNHAYIAGQIGLIPASLKFPNPLSLQSQTILSLKNLERITSVLELDVWKFSVGCICFVDEDTSFEVVQKAWKHICEWRKGENCCKIPPSLYIAVPSLPREAKVEWQVLLHDGKINRKNYNDDLEEGVKSTINSKFPSDMKPAMTFIPVIAISEECAVGICVQCGF
ncbi:1580_t:CDS:10 [Dentiscutata erythropus]|uniref:Diphthine--ammonia ligase n=1 Tax=Dentiscutata erythropus TaxID=1348616 RepID=A0A9N9GW75_9GLOM|nr:1580_t:CDS:10 [Dentiscutata erythropus]